MSPVIEGKDALEIGVPCGALTAMLVIAGLTMSSILIAAVVIFKGLRGLVSRNGKLVLD
jgi:hypothetical protein